MKPGNTNTLFMPFPELGSERLLLRQLNADDNQALLALRSDDSVNKYLDRPPATSLAQVDAFIARINKGITEKNWFYWALCLRNNPSLLGTVCLWNFSADRTEAEIGYEILPQFQSKGLMDEAVKKIIEFGFGELSLMAIYAFTHRDNSRSSNLLIRNQFVPDLSRKSEEHKNELVFVLKKEIVY